MKITKQYVHAAVGGTFDHFHKGHEYILHTAFNSARQVTIGITTDALLQNKDFQNSIQPYSERKQSVLDYLKKNKFQEKGHIVPLNDMFGPAVSDKSMDMIVVSKETKTNAIKINDLRKKAGLHMLFIKTVAFIKSEDKKILRSTRIRQGEINSNGIKYINYFKKKNVITVPSYLKNTLREPFGDILQGNDKNIDKTTQKLISILKKFQYPMVISVGDVISSSLTDNYFMPHIQIIDKKTLRQTYQPTQSVTSSSISKNPAGKIQKAAVLTLKKDINQYIQFKKTSIQLIQGEEDLMALPAMLLAPVGSIVVYGQNNIGIVYVTVTVQLKHKVESLLSQFT
ncbi:MAG TPA: pantetheine-phosphate adenylyltransferase [Candidatus Woesebacteria bacterium]|nr:pantetheine-phosphate adenylyltransferase [Candidatus Woesebacteria bacterium]